MATELCGDGVGSNCRSDGSGGDSDGFGVGTTCNVAAAKGSAGACFGGGTLQCTIPGLPTTKCVAATPAIGQSKPQTTVAPNGSSDWDCDGKTTITAKYCKLTKSLCVCDTKDFGDNATTESRTFWPAALLLLVTQADTPSCADFTGGTACWGRHPILRADLHSLGQVQPRHVRDGCASSELQLGQHLRQVRDQPSEVVPRLPYHLSLTGSPPRRSIGSGSCLQLSAPALRTQVGVSGDFALIGNTLDS